MQKRINCDALVSKLCITKQTLTNSFISFYGLWNLIVISDDIDDFLVIQSIYTSQLTTITPVYRRECEKGNYHYQTVEVNVKQTSTYGFDDTNRPTEMYGYIYKDVFDPFNPKKNLLSESNFSCSEHPFQFTAYLEVNKTYELVVTTLNPYRQGNFTIVVTDASNVTFNRTSKYLNL